MEICSFESLPTKFPAHFHDYWLLGALLCGQRYLFCNNQRLLLEAGDLVALNPFQAHACMPVHETGAYFISLHLSGQAMQKLSGAQASFCLFAKPVYKNLGEKFLQVVKDLENADNMAELKELARSMLQTRPSVKKDPVISNSIMELRQNYEYFNLEALAMHACMGKTGFLRKFSRCTGITPFRYAESLRLIKASKMLKDGCRILDAALAAGYYDQAHFSRVFKANIGMTPASFKNCYAKAL